MCPRAGIAMSAAVHNPNLRSGSSQMKLAKRLFLLAALSLVGCGKPVPPEKSAYVGEWQEQSMYLLITQEGSVRYKRVEGSVTTSVEGPLKGFIGDDFEVGVGPIATTFVVSDPPHLDGDEWKMIVDDVELIRTAR
jgi:hypothetical protein